MSIFQRVFSIFFIVMAGFSTTSCETTSIKPELLQKVQDGKHSAIIMSYKEFQGYYGAYITFANTETWKSQEISMHGGDNWVGAGPAMAVVEPGHYRISTGSLYGYQVGANMPLVEYWFKEFEVAPGEIVDIGTLTLDDVKLRSTAGAAGKVVNALLAFGDTKDSTSYIAYNIDYSDDERVKKMLVDKYPQFAGKPVKRPLVPTIDKQQFETIIADANKPGADGKLPPTQESQRRVETAIIELLSKDVLD